MTVTPTMKAPSVARSDFGASVVEQAACHGVGTGVVVGQALSVVGHGQFGVDRQGRVLVDRVELGLDGPVV